MLLKSTKNGGSLILRKPPAFLYFLIFQRLDRKPGNLNDGSLCHLDIDCLVFDSYDLAVDTAAKHHLASNLQIRMHLCKLATALFYISGGCGNVSALTK